jgi:hypothetical protein
MPAFAKQPRSTPDLTEQLTARLPRPPGQAYLQSGADHGSLLPDLDVPATPTPYL